MKSNQSSFLELNNDLEFYSLVNQAFLPEENFEIEYKSGQGGFPNELWKTYSAFANTNLGFIIIGVKEAKNKLIVEGLSDKQIEHYQKEFWNNCNNPKTISINLLTNEDITVVPFEGKKLLIIRVPFANRTDRPVHLTKNPFGNTYKRNHEGDYKCTDFEVKRMIADSTADLRRDNAILEGFDINDLDPTSIRQYRQLFSSSDAGHPWLTLNDIELLTKIGAYRLDRKTKKEGITLAGLLMFGKDQSLREQDLAPNYFPDFREKLSTDKSIRWTDRIYPDGTWEANLFQFHLRVWPKLIATLPKPFELDKDIRVDESPMHVALREAFINTLIHTDYSLSGNIIIEMDADRFVFSNPGTLLVSLSQYYAGGISECRNPSLQLMFMLIGRAEKAGSGVDKIMSGWNSALWKRPFIELLTQPDKVKLTLPMFSVIPNNILEELHHRFNNLDSLTADELTILAFSLMEGSISNQRLQYVLNIHSADISIILRRLCNNNLLVSDNKGRWTNYKLANRTYSPGKKVATSSKKADYQDDTHITDTNTDTKVATSTAKVATSSKKTDYQDDTDTTDANTDTKVATSTAKVATSSKKTYYQDDTDTTDANTDTKVATSTAKVATSNIEIPKKLSKEKLDILIMELCKNRYVKKEDIALYTNRTEVYIRNKVLPRLLRENKLVKKYPYAQNHPEQAYKTKE